MPTSIESLHVNSHWEPVSYHLNPQEHEALDDLIRFYGPFDLVQRVSTAFGAGGGMPGYVGNGNFFDLGHVMRHVSRRSGLVATTEEALHGGGKGSSLFGMFASTIGEVVERTLGTLEYYRQEPDLVSGSYRELADQGHNCVGPGHLPLLAAEQYESSDTLFDRFTPDTPLRWIQGKRLFSGEAVWLPAQLVLLYYTWKKAEAIIGYSTSGGLACHVSEREALYHGITELIERDAIGVSWHCRVPPRPIDIDRPIRHPVLRAVLAEAARLPGMPRFYLHDLGDPELSVITAIGVDDRFRQYGYFPGGGVDVDVERAMLSAFTEYVQSEQNIRLMVCAPDWSFAQGLHRLLDVDADVDRRKLNLFFQMVPYYGHEENLSKARWYLESGRPIALSTLQSTAADLETRWRRLTDFLKRKKIDPIVYDFTSEQMTTLRLIKVFAPELTLPFPPSAPLLGHPRFSHVPRDIGVSEHPLAYAELNLDPLPFP